MISSFTAIVRIKFSLDENLKVIFKDIEVFPLAFSSPSDFNKSHYERLKDVIKSNPLKIMDVLQIKEEARFEMICKASSFDYIVNDEFHSHHSLDLDDVKTYLLDEEDVWT